MEFSIEKDVFLKGLTAVQGIVERRTTMPILANVLLETESAELRITATDLEVGVCSSYPAQVKKKGKITISARNLYEITRELPASETVSIKKKENDWIEIKCGKALFKLVGLGAEEFPALPAFKDDQFIGIDGEVLDQMLEKAVISVSTDETRYNLNGVYVAKGEGDQMNMVSTDGHRLSVIQKGVEKVGKLKLEKGVIIPRKGLQEVRRIIAEGEGSVEMSFQAGNAVVRKEGRVLVMRLIDGEFPDYRQVLPKEGENKNQLVVDRNLLVGVLRRMAIIYSRKPGELNLNLVRAGYASHPVIPIWEKQRRMLRRVILVKTLR